MSLNANNITFSYGTSKVLDQVDFSIEDGEIMGLLGPNGICKTTLLKCVGGILNTESGQSVLHGQDIFKLSAKERARMVAYVPQFSSITFPVSVFDAVIMGRQPFVKTLPTKEDKEKVADILEKLGLSNHAFKSIMELSGGERQRVMIARAIAQDPKLLLLDEPTSSLDIKYQLDTMKLVETLAREKNLIVMISIHDLNLAAMFCDKFLMLKDAKVYLCGNDEVALTEKSIEEVYGVKSKIQDLELHKHIAILKNQ